MKEANPKKPNMVLRVLTFLLTAVLVLGAIALVVFRDRLNLDSLQRWVSYRGLETSETGEAAPFSYGGGSSVDLGCLNGALLFSSNNSVRLYTNGGSELDNQVLSLAHPVLTTAGDLGAVYDMGGQELRVFDSRGEVFSLTLDEGYGILSARPNAEGCLAVTAQQSGHKRGVTTVYSAGFEPRMEIPGSGFIVDAVLSDDSETVAVATMGEGTQSFESQLVFYPVGETEPQATVSLGNSAVLDLRQAGDTIRVLGENSLTLVAADGSASQVYAFSDRFLKGYDLKGDGFSVLLLGRYRTGNASELAIVGDDGAVLGTLTPDSQVLDLAAAGRYFAVLTADRLEIYTGSMEQYASLENTGMARHVALRDDGAALLANTEQAWLLLP